MSEWNLAQLPWLPKPPADFGARLGTIRGDPAGRGISLLRLAGTSLNASQLGRVAGVVEASRRESIDLSPLIPFRLGLLSNATMDLIGPALVASALRYGIALEVVVAPYDQAVQHALDPDSALNRAKLDGVLALLDHRAYPFQRVAFGDPASARKALEGAVAHLEAIRDGIRTGCGAPLILQTLADIPESLFGSYDLLVDGTCRSLVRTFNDRVVDLVREGDDYLLDVAHIAQCVGLENWHDPQHWNIDRKSVV